MRQTFQGKLGSAVWSCPDFTRPAANGADENNLSGPLRAEVRKNGPSHINGTEKISIDLL